MSTIGSLLALASDPGITPWNDIVKSSTQAQTGLRTLADLKRKQASEALIMERIQNDPALRQRLFGEGSVLGSLPTTGGQPGAPGGAPAAGPITQSQLGGGPSQQIPAYPDASRFANVPPTGGGPIPPNVMGQTMPMVTPPQSVLGSLGPQRGMPGGPQGPQNPLLAMAAKDPRAALMLQQQMQTQQDRQWTMQTQALNNRGKVLDYLGRMAQGATDQDSWKAFLEEADRVQPGSAARLPQTYSKEARDGVVAQALEVKETMTLQVNEMKARADQLRAGLAGRTDAVNTELEIMGLTPATASPAQLKEAADKAEARQVRIHKAGVTPQIVEGEGGVKYSIDPHTLERRPIPGGAPGTATAGSGGGTTAEPMRGPMSADDKKIADYASRMSDSQTQLKALEDSGDYTSWKAPLSRLPGGRMALSDKQQQYETAKGLFLQGILRRDSQGQISVQERADYSRDYFPQPGEGPEIVKQKQAMRDGAIRAQQAVLGRPGVPQGQPTSQGSTGKPVSQMNAEETRAEIAAIKARGGR